MAVENDRYVSRKNSIFLIMACFFAVYLLQLLNLQVFNSQYRKVAEDQGFLHKTKYPARGLIYDRNGKLLVYNKPAYDVMVVMREVEPFDSLDFCRAVNISLDDLRALFANIKRSVGYSRYTPQLLISQLSIEEYAVLQEKLFKFPGFYIQDRTLREYTYPCAAHALGSVGEVSQSDMDADPYYKRGDYAGKNGVEKFYEKELRGKKGVEILLRDVHGRLKGSYRNGELDETPVSGKNIRISIDIDLQQYAEGLMVNKIGSIVAIEPSTGEILTLVSSPSFNPSDLVGRQRGKNFHRLMNDPLKPLLDRPMMARYPPGSTFKPLQALILQKEGVITPSTMYPCHNGFVFGGLRVGCHSHGSPLDMRHAIQTSCNGYFCWGYKALLDRKKYGTIQATFESWKRDVVSFGFGYKTGVDFPNENRGYIPNAAVYDKAYGVNGWRGLTIISNAIGQGEIITTPLQLANYCCAIANRGWWITPHIAKEIDGGELHPQFLEKHVTNVPIQFFEPVIDGMQMSVTGGTSRVATMDSVVVCAKTGTAQNPHGKDHSIFMCFAPRENPRIAIAVFVENGGFGATWAGPIAALMLEKYLNGKVPEKKKHLEERLYKANLIESAATAYKKSEASKQSNKTPIVAPKPSSPATPSAAPKPSSSTPKSVAPKQTGRKKHNGVTKRKNQRKRNATSRKKKRKG